MKHFDKIWRVRTSDSEQSRLLSENLGISEVLARLLTGRGFTEAAEVEAFLNPSMEKLMDPFLMKGMPAAVQRIRLAMEKKERIWIYGDYDVDGITAISLLSRFFKWLGYPVEYYIPDRLEEGYGISEAGIARVRQLGCDLMISVDCGITSVDRVEQARALGMDVIITDHHEPQEILPDAVAVIDTKQADCPYPEKSLSGVGIAFKVAQALAPEFLDAPVASELLQIAALGTVADIVPLIGENRIIVRHGIEALRKKPISGTSALMKASGVDPAKAGTGHIGFMLAPRINAAGRIDQPQKGVELLLTDSTEEADALSEELSALNEERQRIEKRILEEALQCIEKQPAHMKQWVLVVDGEGWHPGVIGIVASRIVERYYRPCILLNRDSGLAKGSARSIEGFNLFEALCSTQELLLKFGGHEMAAGMTLDAQNIPALREALNRYAGEVLTDDHLIPRIQAEFALDAKELQFSLLDDLDALEPFGPGNPKPVFLYRGLTIDQRRLMGKNQEHVKLVAHDGNRVFEAIGFRWPEPGRFAPGQRVDLAFVLERNTFNGVESLQLQMRDSRIRQWTDYRNNPMFRRYWSSFWAAYRSFAALDGYRAAEVFEAVPCPPVKGLSVTDTRNHGHMGTLRILLWTPESFEALLGQLQDTDPGHRIPVYFGDCPSEAVQAVVVNPDFNRIKAGEDCVILFWEKPPVTAVYGWSQACCKNSGILYNEAVGPATVGIMDQLVPSKEALAATYRELRKAGEGSWSLNRYMDEANDPFDLLKEEVRAWVLSENGLLFQEHGENGVCFKIAPHTGEKVNIVDSPSYRFIMSLKSEIMQQMK